MKLTLPKLPFPKDAFEPYISAETIETHYGKHHKSYVDKTNQLLEEDDLFYPTLEDLILQTATSHSSLFNQAAQAWNHTFYWHSLSAGREEGPSSELHQRIQQNFGGLDEMKAEFMRIATTLFGSGWVWLIVDGDGRLSLEGTSNADVPIREGKIPLFTCDVWEHAYYIDYRNERPKYLTEFWKLVNWKFAEDNLERRTIPDMTRFMTAHSEQTKRRSA